MPCSGAFCEIFMKNLQIYIQRWEKSSAGVREDVTKAVRRATDIISEPLKAISDKCMAFIIAGHKDAFAAKMEEAAIDEGSEPDEAQLAATNKKSSTISTQIVSGLKIFLVCSSLF